ncbi:ABC transporter permease [Pseudonocardia sp. KRD-184]|uniref:ABC transporter permease n=1 Tax=Pseudonocardia oceani TaxID=2792013 RepID=A0ABS6U9T0_9PSEU|nr:ABC transporter permease [Pseudonocardia oceani]MBW0089921.1 ABC transporter permease [Pseudonocardia oceani]MBW0094763.1 ABC transporter permease [Pseudonocardia oceani]MBW0109714.1 ABC transporter permease [Pseudonocardia oceani]MBW0120271.1 ABC transporter permease [Pseudonocardia oceani]MBW0128995.1 ABC transporter permease [Pseudonocardia oceani]
MNIAEAARLAFRGLRANKLRSGLTTLGIIIGVAAVIVLVALGNGIQSGFTESFGSLATQISVSANQEGTNGQPRDLTDADVEALADPADAPGVASATPTAGGPVTLQLPGGTQFRSSVVGTVSTYLDVTDRDLVIGRMFDEAEERSKAKVVVLAPGAVEDLFAGDAGAALGSEVRIGRTAFRVIGVVAATGQDDVVIMPLGTARSFLLGGGDSVSNVVVVAVSPEAVPAALAQVTAILDDRHDIDEPAERDYTATAQQSLLDQVNQTLSFLTLFTVAVAAISLIVGGIGVANIMLVTVTERTREIGIRKAIGARRRAILQQFLLESTFLAGFGGIVGILIGVGLSTAAAIALPQAIPDFPPPVVDVNSVIISFVISLLIGLVAGGYPANRAARLRPIEALRFQ